MNQKTMNQKPTDKVHRTIGVVKFIEKAIANTGWFQIAHNGEQSTNRELYGDPSFYTKTYRMVLDGQPTSTYIKFVYSIRDNWADFTIAYSPDSRDTSREIAGRRFIQAMTSTKED